jgi:medium-chain acyl-[acyl-carrier-protein] hydrolase
MVLLHFHDDVVSFVHLAGGITMVFSRDYLVHYYEVDASRRLTLPALVQYFEDIAILHSASVGCDLESYEESHSGWMLLKWDIRVHALPVFGQTVTVGTRVHAIRRFLADREFAMTASDSTILAEARSNWLFTDTIRRRPLRVPDAQYDAFAVRRESEVDFIEIENVDSAAMPSGDSSRQVFTQPVRVATSDIDTNRHVNNVCYLRWACDSLPPEFADAHFPKSLRVQYRKELALGASGEIVSSLDSGVSRHTVRNGDEEFCALEIGWDDRR